MPDRELTRKEAALVVLVGVVIAASAGIAGWHIGYVGLPLPFSHTGKNVLSRSDVDHVYNLIHDYRPASSGTLPSASGTAATGDTAADAIRGMIAGLNDQYSFYVPRDIYQKLLAEERGDVFDVGMLFAREGDALLVLDIQSASPAEAAGVVPGESITAIDGVSVASVHQPLALTTMLFGKPGERVTLTVRTGNNGAQKEIAITHTAYITPNMSLAMPASGVGYLKIYSFDKGLMKNFAIIKNTLMENNIEKLIIDLRNNPGGDVDETTNLLNQFINQGPLFSEEIGPSKPVLHSATGNAPFRNMRIAILVNKFTASAAELFASAMHENQRAVLIGATTTGKATEQSYFELGDGSAVHITDGKWFTAHGDWTGGKGVTPDIAVADIAGATNDEPLRTAIDVGLTKE